MSNGSHHRVLILPGQLGTPEKLFCYHDLGFSLLVLRFGFDAPLGIYGLALSIP